MLSQHSNSPTLHHSRAGGSIKIKLTIAYDGSAYQGWQVQKTGVGIQARIEEALEKLFLQPIRIHSSSRTDTGVHALGMVAHFELPRADFKIPIRRLAIAINANLPPEIRVQNAVRAPFGFHARFDAAGKEYRYFVWTRPSMNPLLRFHAWHVPAALDLLAMRKAAGFFPGRHDFKSFAANRNYEMESTVRTLKRCQIQRRGPLLVFIIEGDGFLYKMCRGIVGTLVQVGQGKIRPDEVRNILAKRDRRVAGMSAPAHGLVLWRVLYAKRRRVA